MLNQVSRPALITSLSSAQGDENERLRSHWLPRMAEALQYERTLLGCILLAACNRRTGRLPAVSNNAVILSNGDLIGSYQSADGTVHRGQVFGNVIKMRDAFRLVAEKIGLSQAEADELFTEIKKWIARDFRQDPPPL